MQTTKTQRRAMRSMLDIIENSSMEIGHGLWSDLVEDASLAFRLVAGLKIIGSGHALQFGHRTIAGGVYEQVVGLMRSEGIEFDIPANQ